MEEMELGEQVVTPGEVRYGALQCGSHRDGTPIEVPFIAANGPGHGPTVCLSSLIHGDEVPGIEVIRRVMQEELDPRELSGAIIALPVLNPLAARAVEHATPEDGGDMCAEFPGDPNGTLTQRLAHQVYQEVMVKCDYYIDFHANWSPAVEFCIVPMCENRQAIEEAVELAAVFGWPVQASRLPKSPAEVMLNAGKPAMLPELVGSGFAIESSIAKAVRGTLNVLTYLGVIEGTIEEQEDVAVPQGQFGRAVASVASSGFVHFTTTVGAKVRRDDVIGIVYDIYGREIETVRSPVTGYVRSFLPGRANQLVHGGQMVATFLVICEGDTLWGTS